MRYYTPVFFKSNPQLKTNWGSTIAWKKNERIITEEDMNNVEKYCVRSYETTRYIFKEYRFKGNTYYHKYEKDRR